jgi:hypothetical protein
MFDARRDLAALVYEAYQDPDAILRDFASDLKARGFRAVGMIQTGQCADSSLSVVLVHSGEKLLLARDFGPAASGCRLDVARLENAGARVADALEAGADLVIINRFGKRERDGRGLTHLIERARSQHSRRDSGIKRPPDGLDRIRGRHDRQACLRSAFPGFLVAQYFGAWTRSTSTATTPEMNSIV